MSISKWLECDCKGTGYLLPKKGELLEFEENIKPQIKFQLERAENIKKEVRERENLPEFGLVIKKSIITPSILKFRLTSDAVLKSVGEIIETNIEELKLIIPKGIWYTHKGAIFNYFEHHNLSESSKIVETEGYYE